MKESYGEGVATHTGPESCARRLAEIVYHIWRDDIDYFYGPAAGWRAGVSPGRQLVFGPRL